MKIVRILAVDDHEMTTLGYKYILEGSEFDDFEVKVEIAKSYEIGKEKIEFSARSLNYNIILLDIQLFPASAKDQRSGEDLGILARELVPESKIVFMSSFSDNYRIDSICKTVDPDGYMVKSEIDEESLLAMVKTVTSDSPYYTASALRVFRKRMANDTVIDEQDKKILYLLSIGTRTKDIPPLISASHATVESRKRQLKTLFGVDNGNDFALIEQAKERGFI
ncbi:MAG: histidine kinase [Flavobacteriaceae bacterium]